MIYAACCVIQAETAVQSETATGASHEESSTAAETTNDDNEDLTSMLPPGELMITDDPDIVNVVNSLTLPRIEHVLRSEGVRPLSISQQIDSLRKKVERCRFSTSSPNSFPLQRPGGWILVCQKIYFLFENVAR